MLSVGKYKLIVGSIIGATGGAYGSYELYNHFGPGGKGGSAVASARIGKDKEAAEEGAKDVQNPVELSDALPEEEQDHVDPEKEPESPKVVEQQSEAEEKEQHPQPKEDAKPKIEVEVESKTPSNVPEAKTVVKAKPQSPRNQQKRLTYNFYDSDGRTIKIQPNTQGYKFKDSLITDTKDAEAWNKKVEALNVDLDYQATREKEGKGHINAIPQEFRMDRTTYKNYITQELQKRCFNAYRKKSWSDLTVINRPPITNERMRQYWTMVWKFCGKPTHQDTPSGGYNG